MTDMNIYLVETTLPQTYDCANGFVVRAENEIQAVALTMGQWGDHNNDAGLLPSLTVTGLGIVPASLYPVERGVILRSFDAG